MSICTRPDVQTVPISRAILDEMREHCRRWFGVGVNWNSDICPEDYHEQVRRAQDTFNARGFGQRIAWDIRPALYELLQSEHPVIQRTIYLRAARPNGSGQESVGWHRESFYGCPDNALNVWVPLFGCTAENVIRYVPGSAEIPNEAIELAADDSHGIERGSAGHKVGLLYAPKRIVSGVDFSTAQPLPFKDGHASVFSAQLIHGAAENRTNQIRFSVDFRVTTKQAAIGGKEMWDELICPNRGNAKHLGSTLPATHDEARAQGTGG